MNVYDDFTLALSSVPMPGDWSRLGRCRSAPPGVFFPTRGEDLDHAKAICALCPVQAECLQYALAAPDLLQGVWAGTSAQERRDLRRQQRERPVEAPRASQAARGSLDRMLQRLTGHPGRWARVTRYQSKDSAASMASLLRTGQRHHPSGRWEFEGRMNDVGGSDLYALYVGADERVEVAS